MNGISVSKVPQPSPREDWQKRSAAFRAINTLHYITFRLPTLRKMLFSSRLYGLLASRSVTGISNHQLKWLLLPRMLPILTMYSLTSMSHSKRFNSCLFNMHGFLNSLSMVKELC